MKLHMKSLTVGLILGTMVTATISAFGAANEKIEAWKANNTLIYVDGKPVSLPDDMHVLNYEGRIYTPARAVAEAMGGTVGWDDINKKVLIDKPKPEKEYVEVEVEKIIEKPSEIVYYKPPARHKVKDSIINFIGWSRYPSLTYIYFDIENKEVRDLRIDVNNAYIEVNGKKYNSVHSSNYHLLSSLQPNAVIKDEQIVFEGFPDNTTKVRIVMPILIDEFAIPGSNTQTKFLIDCYVDFSTSTD